MFRSKAKLFLASLGVSLLMPVAAWAAAAPPSTVTITGTVDTFAEWADVAPTVAAGDWDGHITQANQSRTVTKALTLYANVDTTITPSADAGGNNGILKSGAQALATSYKLTGSVTTPDAAFKAAGTGVSQFFNSGNTYTVTHESGTGAYTVNLVTQMVSGAAAPDAGDYTCGVILTASW